MFGRGRDVKSDEKLQIGLEHGRDDYAIAWCFALPGCAALVPPGADPLERAALAVAEFVAWSHNRAADRLQFDVEHVEIVQVVRTDVDLFAGESTSFFMHDAEPPGTNEFPLWSTAHDRALDELRELALSLPPALLDHKLGAWRSTPLEIVDRATAQEREYAAHLDPARAPFAAAVREPGFKALQHAHLVLQQIVCDVPPGMKVQGTNSRGQHEAWSVRRVMRLSTWQLRRQTWDLRKQLSTLWLGD